MKVLHKNVRYSKCLLNKKDLKLNIVEM